MSRAQDYFLQAKHTYEVTFSLTKEYKLLLSVVSSLAQAVGEQDPLYEELSCWQECYKKSVNQFVRDDALVLYYADSTFDRLERRAVVAYIDQVKKRITRE